MTAPNYKAHPSAVIDPGAEVGPDTRIWHFCHVMPGARIGARCVLGQNVHVANKVKIGDGCKIQNNVSLYDGVELEDEVFVGPSAVFTNIATPRAFVNRRHAYQPTRICRGASIGANATIVCGVTIGRYALIGAGAVVTRDIPAHALVVGVPARHVNWVCRCGVTLDHGRACQACNTSYKLLPDNQLVIEDDAPSTSPRP